MQVPEALRDEIAPKNIIMIGPTGVGKTEIARRLARLAQAPFIKVEATKFTEVGYVGRDVEQIVRDLLEVAITLTRERKRKDVKVRAEQAAEARVVDALVGPNASASTKDAFRKKLRAGELNDTCYVWDIAGNTSVSVSFVKYWTVSVTVVGTGKITFGQTPVTGATTCTNVKSK